MNVIFTNQIAPSVLSFVGEQTSPRFQDIKARLDLFRHMPEKDYKFVLACMNSGPKQEAAAAPVVAPSGRGSVHGRIVSAKWKSHDYGTSLKVTVALPNGAKVWGTLPAQIVDWAQANIRGQRLEDAVKGLEVAFTATFEQKRGDHTFSFFNRGTKGRVAPVEAILDGLVESGQIGRDDLEDFHEVLNSVPVARKNKPVQATFEGCYGDGDIRLEVDSEAKGPFNARLTVTNDYSDLPDLVVPCNV